MALIYCFCSEFSAIARKEIETKGYTLPLAQNWIKQESIHRNQTGINPSTQNWPGDLNFDLRIPAAIKSKDAQVPSLNNESDSSLSIYSKRIHTFIFSIFVFTFLLVFTSSKQTVHQSKSFCQYHFCRENKQWTSFTSLPRNSRSCGK